ncbi:MAG: ATP synthase F0 subunit B [Myxococcales bacterium]|nr:ATP synthase F0 subunit B [Myxococcales bacterium]
MKRSWLWLPAVLLLLATAAPVLAAEEEGFLEAHKMLIENLTALVNFLIFLYIIVRFAGPKMKAYFDNSAGEYTAKVTEAAKVLADAQQLHEEWTSRRTKLEQEVERIKHDVQAMAEAQAREILANAQRTAERIIADTKRSAEGELLKAKEELRAELVEQLLADTEKKLQSRLSPSHQHMLIEEAIKKLEASQ